MVNDPGFRKATSGLLAFIVEIRASLHFSDDLFYR